jgi:hypothetical protein
VIQLLQSYNGNDHYLAGFRVSCFSVFNNDNNRDARNSSDNNEDGNSNSDSNSDNN